MSTPTREHPPADRRDRDRDLAATTVAPEASFARGDPNQRMIGLAGRFLRPALLLSLGAALFVLDRAIWPGSHLDRLGVTLLLVGSLWATAIGFALGTLRLVAGLMLIVIVFLLTSVGGNTGTEAETTEVRSLRSELEIELNLLRGPRTTRADVTEKLLASATSQLEGQRVRNEADVAADVVEDRLAPDDPIAVLIDDRVKDLDSRLQPTRDAIEESWRILHPGWPTPFDPSPNPDNAASGEPGTGEAGQAEVADGDQTSDVADGDQTEGDLVDPRAEEPADAGARDQLDLAIAGADAIDATVGQLKPVIQQLQSQPSDEELRALSQSLPPVPSAQNGPDCSDTSAVPAVFSAVTSLATACISGCDGGDGPCEPLAAKRILLLGFKEQLALLTRSEVLTESQAPLVARLDEIQAELDALDEPVAIHRLALVGADQLLGDAVQALVLDDDRPAGLGGWGWLVLTVACIVGYRLLEMANDRRSPGPVSVVAGDSGKDTTEKTAAATALIRAHLTAVNLQEPSPLPGGEAVSSISTSTEAAGFENAVVKYVVSLLQNTAFPRRGIDLIVTAQPAAAGLTSYPNCNGDETAPNGEKGATTPAPDRTKRPTTPPAVDEPYRVMIRATNTRQKGLMFSHPFQGETLDEVTHAAAYFAAERLLDAGWTTPSWLVWSSHDGSALRAYRKVMIDKSNPPGLEPTADGKKARSPRSYLREAVRSSPGTGAALVALSHEAVLEGDLAAALHHLLLARVRHERFLTVRYRLGVTMSMMALDIDRHWRRDETDPNSGWPADTHISGAIHELRDDDDEWPRSDLPRGAACSRLLLQRSVAELDFVIDAVRFHRITSRSLRQAEREYWLGLLRSSRRRRGLWAGALAAKALAARRLVLVEEELGLPLTCTAEQCDGFIHQATELSPDDWLVRYNAACYTAALIQEADDAADQGRYPPAGRSGAEWAAASFDHLRRSRYARNGQQLSARWTYMDPDLRPLARFCQTDDVWRHRLAEVFQMHRNDLDDRIGEVEHGPYGPTKHKRAVRRRRPTSA